MTRSRSPGVMAVAVGLIVLMALGSVAMWVVNPVFWLWLASRLEQSSQPSLGPYLLVLAGIPVTMYLIGNGLARLNRTYGRVTRSTPEVRVQLPWHRSLRGDRDTGRPRTVLDVVMVCSVSLAGLAFAIWFFGFAGSSLPK